MRTGWRFDERVVLVTGASQGIGAVLVEEFARHGSAGVAINYPPEPTGEMAQKALALAVKIDALVGRSVALPVPADVTDTPAVEAMMAAVYRRWGRLDVLVNNAGILRDRSLAKMTEDEWLAVMNTNLTGVFRVCRAALPLMTLDGRIINIASLAGQKGIFGQTNYGAAKAGVMGFTRALAAELARKEITVNAVAPGLVDTPMAARIPTPAREALLAQIPMGRMGTPADVANAVLFLASLDSGYITGQTLNVNGGWL